MVDYLDGFPYVEPSLHPGDKLYMVMVDDCFDVFLDLVCKNFIEYFCTNVNWEISLKFSFFLVFLCGFTMSIIVTSKNELAMIIFKEELLLAVVPDLQYYAKGLKIMKVIESFKPHILT